MRVMLVDDEPLALRYLSEELRRFEGIEITGTYRNPRLALESLTRDKPDAVFLDIEMPELSGIELAELITQTDAQVHLVFVTVYDEFAVKAFELNALDYLLKPIQAERLSKTLKRLFDSVNDPSQPQTDRALARIYCFRSLQFERSGQERVSLRWKTLKAQELFCLLLKHRGKPVRKEMLVEQIWPDMEWKKGITQLYTAIYQIRRLLQTERFEIEIASYDGGYRMDVQHVRIDTEEWELQLKSAPPLNEHTLAQHLQLLEQYEGDYLAEYEYGWAQTERRRLREMWLSHAKLIAQYYVSSERLSDAAAHYLRLQSVGPTEESFYHELMLIYDRMGDRRSVEKQYELLGSMLHKELDAEPDEAVQQWFEQWRHSDHPLS
ncbi:response regulator [Paenibacillus sp. YYML68]|uniref:response regulator n=1 Tax=Paenibacillus sp. YYML68 TaxID=2909250 RepID=UPI0024915FDF|nr:response regulator [Paenibacillus sp. YYML68]